MGGFMWLCWWVFVLFWWRILGGGLWEVWELGCWRCRCLSFWWFGLCMYILVLDNLVLLVFCGLCILFFLLLCWISCSLWGVCCFVCWVGCCWFKGFGVLLLWVLLCFCVSVWDLLCVVGRILRRCWILL